MTTRTTLAPLRGAGALAPFIMEDLFRRPEWLLSSEFLPGDGHIRVDEYQDGGNLMVRAELPGIDPEKDVELTVDDGALTIRAERKREEVKEGAEYHFSEMRYGVFTKTLPLPVGAKIDKVKATYANGVLEVCVPVDKEHTRKIPIGKS